MNITLEDLKAHLDGELPLERHAEIERALETDPALRTEASRLEMVSRAIGNEVPISVVGRERAIDAVLRRSQKRVRWGISPWVWAAGTACVVILGVLSIPKTAPQGFQMQPASYSPATASKSVGTAGVMESPGTAAADAATEESHPQSAAPSSTLNWSAANEKSDLRLERSRAKVAAPLGGIDIARSAEMTLRVDDARIAKGRLENEAKRLGGFVAAAAFDHANETPTAHVALRVPSARLDVMIVFAKELGGLVHEDSNAEDVTAERIDEEARLENLKREEGSLRAVLDKAKKVPEILEVRQQLTEVRGNIESLSAQLKELKGRVALSRLDVTLEQRPRASATPTLDDGWPRDTAQGAVASLKGFGRKLGSAAIYLAVFAIPVVPVVVVALLMRRRR